MKTFYLTRIFLIAMILSSVKNYAINKNIDGNEPKATGVKKQFTPGVFKVDGIGYQGIDENEINQLDIFVIKPGKNVTQKINKAIVKASKNGGIVVLKKGNYTVGSLVLQSNVHIRLKAGSVLIADQTNPAKARKRKEVFVIGNTHSLKNVSIVGEGKGKDRAVIRYIREEGLAPKQGGTRAFSIGSIHNLFIQNILIEDDQTRFSGVAFHFLKGDYTDKGRAVNVTVDHVEQTNASFGYGLIQTNTGRNVLLSNLTCSGGVTARIETDNRSHRSSFGVDNIRVENVVNTKGKAAVYLNPHTIENGDVVVDGVHAYSSQFAIEIREGYLDDTGKARFGVNSSIKNVSAIYTLDAPVHFAGAKSIPNCLKRYFIKAIPIDSDNKGVRKGPSVAVIGDYANQFIIDIDTVFAYVPENNTNVDNTVASRKMIINNHPHRGKHPDKQCGDAAYD